MLLALAAAVVLWWLLARWARRYQDKTGRIFPAVRVGLVLCLVLPALVWALYGAPTAMDVPSLQGFNFSAAA